MVEMALRVDGLFRGYREGSWRPFYISCRGIASCMLGLSGARRRALRTRKQTESVLVGISLRTRYRWAAVGAVTELPLCAVGGRGLLRAGLSTDIPNLRRPSRHHAPPIAPSSKQWIQVAESVVRVLARLKK